jgi:dephospho-CoA kinase
MERLARTRGMTADQVRDRLASQMPESEMMARATVVIDNRGDLKFLRDQVREAWDELKGGHGEEGSE